MKIPSLLIVFLLSLILASCGNAQITGKTVLFYGNTCPHCKQLDEDLSKYKVEDKLQFERKEVYDNKANANLLGATAAKCGLNPNKVGVPFLYAEDKCFMGVPDIKKYIGEKTGIAFENTDGQNTGSPSATSK